jgi:hypothetical protein
VDDHDLLARDHDLPAMAERLGVTFIGWRALRRLQRSGA